MAPLLHRAAIINCHVFMVHCIECRSEMCWTRLAGNVILGVRLMDYVTSRYNRDCQLIRLRPVTGSEIYRLPRVPSS